MTYFYIFLGFAALIILHEGGHFLAAKAVGMRVERFSLFFGRTPLRLRRGETEYGIGWLPAGGYVKITGMSPHEVLPEAADLEEANEALQATRDELEAEAEARWEAQSKLRGELAGAEAQIAQLTRPQDPGRGGAGTVQAAAPHAPAAHGQVAETDELTAASARRDELQKALTTATAAGDQSPTTVRLRELERSQVARAAELQGALDKLTPRFYINQPPWKRIVVIAAGPAVNLVLAFLILGVIYMVTPQDTSQIKATVVSGIEKGEPAAGHLKNGDRLVSVDNVSGKNPNNIIQIISADKCAGPQTNGCTANQPVTFVVRRHGRTLTIPISPRYNAKAKRMLIGFGIGAIPVTKKLGPGSAAHESAKELWTATTTTLSKFAHIFRAKDRKQFHSVVGIVDIEHQEFSYDTTAAFGTIALISLSLAIVNLFPFLPLDGGHIFWAVAEKLRRRRIPFYVMERASVVGFVLVLMIFAVGLTNDVSSLSNGGLHVPR